MKMKKEYIILPALIAALSAYLVLRKTDRTYYELPRAQALSEADITKIQVDKGDESIVLVRKGEDWEISPQGYRADADKVNGILEILKNITFTALVSEAKDYNRYDLDDRNKIRVRAWASNDLKRDLDVGKAAPTYRHTFVRTAGDDRVYHARENFRGKFDQTVEDFRDKTVLAFDPGNISEISIDKEGESLVLNRKEAAQETVAGGASKNGTIWRNSAAEPIDEKALSSLLKDLSALKCERYLEGAKKDFRNPIYEIGLKGEKDYRLSIFAGKDKEAKERPAVSSESDYPFLLPAWRLEKIMKGPAQLIQKPVPEETSPGQGDSQKSEGSSADQQG